MKCSSSHFMIYCYTVEVTGPRQLVIQNTRHIPHTPQLLNKYMFSIFQKNQHLEIINLILMSKVIISKHAHDNFLRKNPATLKRSKTNMVYGANKITVPSALNLLSE